MQIVCFFSLVVARVVCLFKLINLAVREVSWEVGLLRGELSFCFRFLAVASGMREDGREKDLGHHFERKWKLRKEAFSSSIPLREKRIFFLSLFSLLLCLSSGHSFNWSRQQSDPSNCYNFNCMQK